MTAIMPAARHGIINGSLDSVGLKTYNSVQSTSLSSAPPEKLAKSHLSRLCCSSRPNIKQATGILQAAAP